MKVLKKSLAIVLAALLALCIVGCHQKNEIAVTVGESEFTSAYYMCALIDADMEAQGKVYETLSETEKSAGTIDYYSKKIDKKDYSDWVKDRAIEMLKEIAAYKAECKKADLKIDDAVATQTRQYANYYWNNAQTDSSGNQSGVPLSEIYGKNGVSEATYTQYLMDSNYSSLYFDHLYGAEGTKAVSDDELKQTLSDNFVAADLLWKSFDEETTDEMIEETKKTFDQYMADLKKGRRTYAEIYKELFETDPTSETPSVFASDAAAERFGSNLSSMGIYTSEDYDKIKELADGDMTVVEQPDKAGIVLYIKRDLVANEDLVKSLDNLGRRILREDESNKEIKKIADAMKVDISSHAVDRFKVKKIKYPETQAAV